MTSEAPKWAAGEKCPTCDEELIQISFMGWPTEYRECGSCGAFYKDPREIEHRRLEAATTYAARTR